MNESSKNLSTHNGIYIFLNVLECKVYVGQANKFNKRDHFKILEDGKDNKNLQNDYNKGKEFIYFVVADSETDSKKETLDLYEKLFMTLFEDLGYNLYNTNIARTNRTIEGLGKLAQEEYKSAMQSVEKDFLYRFGKTTQELLNSSYDERKVSLEKYVSYRLIHRSDERIQSDRFFFNRDRISSILTAKRVAINSLNLDELFFSNVGNYLSEGIEQILYYENETIKDHKYCLWTFASNAVSVDTVRSCCREREKNNLDTYVLFSVTPSSKYACSEAYKHPILKRENTRTLSESDIAFLNFHEEENGDYRAPESIDCTAAKSTSSSAFVIQELILLDENIVKSELSKHYSAVGKDGNYDFSRRLFASTFYLKHREEVHADKELFFVSNKRSFCFLGKLVAPYIIRLDNK